MSPSFERLQAELTLAFAAPDATYPLTAAEVISGNQDKSFG